MECFPNRIAKAIFLAASMVCNGQRTFDVFAVQVKYYVILALNLLKKPTGKTTPYTNMHLQKSGALTNTVRRKRILSRTWVLLINLGGLEYPI
jgi:hypothetical protein